jgi:WhiB family redox-sensing transcriptional regulator
MSSQEWRDRAACRGEDGELFFPTPGATDQTEAAKTVCHRCEVRDACLDWALEGRLDAGVWGGMDEEERLKERRRRARRTQPKKVTA